MDNEFRSHILQLIADERAKKNPIQKQLNEIDKRISALELTLQIYGENIPSSKRISDDAFPLDELKAVAKTIPQALVFIAKHNNGVIHYGKARDIVIAAGLSSGKARNVASHIFNVMSNSDEWEKQGEGWFKLVEGKIESIHQVDFTDAFLRK